MTLTQWSSSPTAGGEPRKSAVAVVQLVDSVPYDDAAETGDSKIFSRLVLEAGWLTGLDEAVHVRQVVCSLCEYTARMSRNGADADLSLPTATIARLLQVARLLLSLGL